MSVRDTIISHDRFKANRGERHINDNGKLTYSQAKGYWKDATCKDIQCHEYENGWVSTVPQTELQMLADIYRMRTNGTWEFAEERVELLGGETGIRFTFPPGQTCFRHLGGTGHKVPVERDPRFYHRAAGRPTKPNRIYYDEFFHRYNETAYQATQRVNKG